MSLAADAKYIWRPRAGPPTDLIPMPKGPCPEQAVGKAAHSVYTAPSHPSQCLLRWSPYTYQQVGSRLGARRTGPSSFLQLVCPVAQDLDERAKLGLPPFQCNPVALSPATCRQESRMMDTEYSLGCIEVGPCGQSCLRRREVEARAARILQQIYFVK